MVKRTLLFLLCLWLGRTLLGPPLCSPDPHSWQELDSKIRATVRKLPGKTGLVVQDLSSGKSLSISGDDLFPAASVIKIPIMAAVFHESREGRIRLDEQMVIESRFKVGGSGILKQSPEGSKIRIGKLVFLTITQSDNTATDMLISRVGMKRINEVMKGMGLKRSCLRRTIWDFKSMDRGMDNLTTPAEMARLLRRIYRGEAVDKESSARMMEILKQAKRDLIAKAVPPGIPVVHKTGQLAGNVNDAAIVLAGKTPYLLCIMTRETDDAFAREAIQEITVMVHRFFVSRKP
ncbi:MAG: serine hydrolase [Armatimonadetes bacterium]|nr:serine hydrolase [Armatimonadota bacterium]